MVHSVSVQVKLWDPWERMPYLSALEVCSRQGAIQIHVYFYLYLNYFTQFFPLCEQDVVGVFCWINFGADLGYFLLYFRNRLEYVFKFCANRNGFVNRLLFKLFVSCRWLPLVILTLLQPMYVFVNIFCENGKIRRLEIGIISWILHTLVNSSEVKILRKTVLTAIHSAGARKIVLGAKL